MLTNTKFRKEWIVRTGKLSKPVISCVEAAREKEIDLVHELKSILMCDRHFDSERNVKKSNFFFAHVTGDTRISTKRLKKIIPSRNVSPAKEALLDLKFGVTPGTVTPIIHEIWTAPHFLDKSLLQLDWVSTNDGTSTGWVVFDPKCLLFAPLVRVAEISK